MNMWKVGNTKAAAAPPPPASAPATLTMERERKRESVEPFANRCNTQATIKREMIKSFLLGYDN